MAFATMIGSLPHTSALDAVDDVLRLLPDCPAWPQLPRLGGVREQMHVQYTEGLPGIVVDEGAEKVHLDEAAFAAGLEAFYQRYLDADLGGFAVSPAFAAGFGPFLRRTGAARCTRLKLQVIGPISLGLTLKTAAGRALFYDPAQRDVVQKLVVMKAAWQLREVLAADAALAEVLLFLDEPYLAAYGSAFTAVSREELVACLRGTATELRDRFEALRGQRSVRVRIGVHCCGNTDWAILADALADIISFDAIGFTDGLGLYAERLRSFVGAGGSLAWGAVPNTTRAHDEDAAVVCARIEAGIEGLARKGVSASALRERIIITPGCGLGGESVDTARRSLALCAESAQLLGGDR